MGEVKLYHPVDEDKAREFVDATYVPADGLDEDQQNAEKDRQVETLLAGARENVAWRESRSADEQVKLANVPFAAAPDADDPSRTGEGADE